MHYLDLRAYRAGPSRGDLSWSGGGGGPPAGAGAVSVASMDKAEAHAAQEEDRNRLACGARRFRTFTVVGQFQRVSDT